MKVTDGVKNPVDSQKRGQNMPSLRPEECMSEYY